MSQWGFGLLGASWLFTTYMAFTKIKALDIHSHQQWMIRSYALAFAAVTLRIYMPFMQAGLGMAFIDAYLIVAWLCWVPNLVVAELIIRKYIPCCLSNHFLTGQRLMLADLKLFRQIKKQ